MRIFGDLIQFLDISFANITESDGIEIIGLINDNCTESLSQLHLKECFGNVLNPLNKIFRNVYIATYSTSSVNDLKIASNGLSLKLSEIFPKLARLQVKIADINDWQMIGDEFPYLRSLVIDLPEPVCMDTKQPNVASLLKNSPNINSLVMRYSSLALLKVASTSLSNLKVLHLLDFSMCEYDGDKIYFKNVVSLDILSTCSDEQIPDKLVFNNVHRLTMRFDFRFTDRWIRFFRNLGSKTLEFLDIELDAMTTKQLLAIADTQPNIKIARIVSAMEISGDAIIGFVQRCSNLFELQIEMGLIDVNERNMLEERLHNEWDITYNYLGRNGVIAISFTR